DDDRDGAARLAPRADLLRPAAAVRLADAARRARATRDHRALAESARRHLLAGGRVALGLGDDARQDDGPRREPGDAIHGRVRSVGGPRGPFADGRALADVDDQHGLLRSAGDRLLGSRPELWPQRLGDLD